MAQAFPETSHNKIDQEKFEKNRSQIDWSKICCQVCFELDCECEEETETDSEVQGN